MSVRCIPRFALRAHGIVGLAMVLSALAVSCKAALGWVGGVNVSSADPRSAANPLSGGPITFSDRARDHDLAQMGEQDCTTWPLADQWTVTSSSDKLCVDATLTYGVGPGYGAAPLPPKWTFVGDGGKSSPIDASNAGPPRKVGECTGESKSYTVWQHHVTGCANNDGVLTATTKHLSIQTSTLVGDYDVAAWTLESHEAATAIATASNTSSSTVGSAPPTSHASDAVTPGPAPSDGDDSACKEYSRAMCNHAKGSTDARKRMCEVYEKAASQMSSAACTQVLTAMKAKGR
jgi:hypothetical protein